MKIIRILTVLIFTCACVLWGTGKVYLKNQDNEAPVITAKYNALHVKKEWDEEELKKDLVATDNVDGDLTDEILIGNFSPFIDKGVCTLEYLVFDSNNNVGRYERTIYFDDYQSPKLVLKEPLMYKQNSEIVLSDRLFAIDQLEGDISEKLRFSTAGTTQYTSGVYKLNVSVKNSFGDKVEETLLLNVIPYDTDKGYIKLKEYLIYVPAGTKINPTDYIEKVIDCEGNPVSPDMVTVTSEVNMNKRGTGQFRYEIKDDHGQVAITYLAVIVTD